MATLIVETGTVVTGANTYYSLASADDYFETRGNITWVDYDEDEKIYALIKSCQYMETLEWDGVKSLSTQELVWPRIGMEDEDGYSVTSSEIPKRVKWAQAELAYRYLTEEIEPDIDTGAGAIKSEQVDVIKVEYFNNTRINKIYQRVDSLLSPFIKYGGGGSCIIEVIRG